MTRLLNHEFREEIKRKGWSTSALALKWGITVAYLNQVIRDNERPTRWNVAITELEPFVKSDKEVFVEEIITLADSFRQKTIDAKGHVLLVGVTGTGKSIILENYLKHFPASYHNFETKKPTEMDLEEEKLFADNSIAIIDNIDFDSESAKPLLPILLTGRARGHMLVISTQKIPPKNYLYQFSEVYELKKSSKSGAKTIVLETIY